MNATTPSPEDGATIPAGDPSPPWRPSELPNAHDDRSQPTNEPLTVRVELVVIDGVAGSELLDQQAAVVCEALQWFAEHRDDEYGQQQ
jgi:hypothetical protein